MFEHDLNFFLTYERMLQSKKILAQVIQRLEHFSEREV